MIQKIVQFAMKNNINLDISYHHNEHGNATRFRFQNPKTKAADEFRLTEEEMMYLHPEWHDSYAQTLIEKVKCHKD